MACKINIRSLASVAAIDAEAATQDAAKKTDLRFRQSDLLIRQKNYAEAEVLVRSILAESGSDKEIKARTNQELILFYQV